jgi:hypothetical protein
MRPNLVFIKVLQVSALIIAASTSALADQALSDESRSEIKQSSHLEAIPSKSSGTLPARELLSNMDATKVDSFYDRFHLSRKGRLEYRQEFQAGSNDVSLKLYGPVVKKRPGIGIKVMGLSVADHPLEIKGYANTRRQALIFTIRF